MEVLLRGFEPWGAFAVIFFCFFLFLNGLIHGEYSTHQKEFSGCHARLKKCEQKCGNCSCSEEHECVCLEGFENPNGTGTACTAIPPPPRPPGPSPEIAAGAGAEAAAQAQAAIAAPTALVGDGPGVPAAAAAARSLFHI
jgi:hypothetical protein